MNSIYVLMSSLVSVYQLAILNSQEAKRHADMKKGIDQARGNNGVSGAQHIAGATYSRQQAGGGPYYLPNDPNAVQG